MRAIGQGAAELEICQRRPALPLRDPRDLPAVDDSLCDDVLEHPGRKRDSGKHDVVGNADAVGPIIRQQTVATPAGVEAIDRHVERVAPNTQSLGEGVGAGIIDPAGLAGGGNLQRVVILGLRTAPDEDAAVILVGAISVRIAPLRKTEHRALGDRVQVVGAAVGAGHLMRARIADIRGFEHGLSGQPLRQREAPGVGRGNLIRVRLQNRKAALLDLSFGIDFLDVAQFHAAPDGGGLPEGGIANDAKDVTVTVVILENAAAAADDGSPLAGQVEGKAKAGGYQEGRRLHDRLWNVATQVWRHQAGVCRNGGVGIIKLRIKAKQKAVPFVHPALVLKAGSVLEGQPSCGLPAVLRVSGPFAFAEEPRNVLRGLRVVSDASHQQVRVGVAGGVSAPIGRLQLAVIVAGCRFVIGHVLEEEPEFHRVGPDHLAVIVAHAQEQFVAENRRVVQTAGLNEVGYTAAPVREIGHDVGGVLLVQSPIRVAQRLAGDGLGISNLVRHAPVRGRKYNLVCGGRVYDVDQTCGTGPGVVLPFYLSRPGNVIAVVPPQGKGIGAFLELMIESGIDLRLLRNVPVHARQFLMSVFRVDDVGSVVIPVGL